MRAAGIAAGVLGMGAKYLPTTRDLKASRRFQEQQAEQAKRKQAEAAAAKKAKAKK